MVKSKTLGKGLDALLPVNDQQLTGGKSPHGVLLGCDVNQITPNPYQPRTEMNPEALKQLASSIKEKGVLQPLLVRKKAGSDGYELIAGERRLQAAKMAGLEEVPVIVKSDTSKADRLELAIIENIQRQNLNALEEAEAYARLMQEFGHTQEEVAQKVGRERSTIANTLRLIQLPPFAKADLAAGVISAGHARVILSVTDQGLMRLVRDEVVQKNLSVRQAEELAKKLKRNQGKTRSANENKGKQKSSGEIPESYCQTLTNDISRKLECNAKIIQNGSRGKIEIEYYSLDDLERLVSLIASAKP